MKAARSMHRLSDNPFEKQYGKVRFILRALVTMGAVVLFSAAAFLGCAVTQSQCSLIQSYAKAMSVEPLHRHFHCTEGSMSVACAAVTAREAYAGMIQDLSDRTEHSAGKGNLKSALSAYETALTEEKLIGDVRIVRGFKVQFNRMEKTWKGIRSRSDYKKLLVKALKQGRPLLRQIDGVLNHFSAASDATDKDALRRWIADLNQLHMDVVYTMSSRHSCRSAGNTKCAAVQDRIKDIEEMRRRLAAPSERDAGDNVDYVSAPTPTRPHPSGDVVKVAITSQGGISLGAYEAGLQWSIMELLRKRRFDGSGGTATAYPEIKTDLVASAGASAGNANTFLGLLSYCRAEGVAAKGIPDGQAYSDNWFWDTWVPMGLDQLFFNEKTRNKEAYCRDLGELAEKDLQKCLSEDIYDAEDALLTRKAYLRMQSRLARMFGKDAEIPLDASCLYPVAVPLTQTSVQEFPWQSYPDGQEADLIRFPVTRAVAALQPYCIGEIDADGRCIAQLQNYAWPDADAIYERRIGRHVRVPEAHVFSDTIGHHNFAASESINTIIEAGSAVPFAFGPRQMEICDENGERPLAEGTICPDGVRSTARRWWWDGGMYDNLPIASAFELIRSEESKRATETLPEKASVSESSAKAATNDDIHLIAVDVSRPRRIPRFQNAAEPARNDITSVLETLASVLPVSRKYELQALSRYFPHARETSAPPPPQGGIYPFPTSRYFPVVGESLGAFGAFLGRPFREYDFHMGVYDGIHYLSQAICVGFGPRDKGRPAKDAWMNRVRDDWQQVGETALKQCVVNVFRGSYTDLGLLTGKSSKGKTLSAAALEENIELLMGSVAVLTALRTETDATNRFVVDNMQFEDFFSEASFVGESRLNKYLSFNQQNGPAHLAETCGEYAAPLPVPDFVTAESKNRFEIFQNILETGRCIATVGPVSHPDEDELWLARVLGREFLYFVARLRGVKKSLKSLRKDYAAWAKNKEARPSRPYYIESGMVEMVDDVELWSRNLARQFLDRLWEINNETGAGEVLVDLLQYAVAFKERSEKNGFKAGPTTIPWSHPNGRLATWAGVSAYILLPSFIGTGFEAFPGRGLSMVTVMDYWRLQWAPGKQHVFSFDISGNLMLQYTKYRRVSLGGKLGFGFSTSSFLSQVEPFVGSGAVLPLNTAPFSDESALTVQGGLSLYFANDIFCISGGARHQGVNFDIKETWTGFAVIGIMDIPGFVYWLARIAI